MHGEYYKTKESVDEYIKLAKDINGAQLIKKLEAVLPANSTLLEIGSGPGTDWGILNKSYNIISSDNSEMFLNHLTNEHPKGKFLKLDAVTLKTSIKFDGIYSNKVMHHLSDAELVDSIEKQHEILKPNGIICHSFWRGQGSEVFKGLFVNYHNKNSLKGFFNDRFEVLLIEDYNEFEKEDSILLIAKKK